jgi:hypothetical protein
MISHEHKAIIVHIPKTGGTSIENALKMSKSHGRHLMGVVGRTKYKVWNEYYKFSFVRNPWDRMVSIFHYYKLGKEPENKPIRDILKDVDFNQFITNISKHSWLKELLVPQKAWITDENGEILVDFVGRFENYKEDSEKVLAKLGVDKPIPHDRKSERGDYKSYYNDNTIEIVRELFKEDIEFFNYKY